MDQFVGEMLKLRDEIVSIDRCVMDQECSKQFLVDNLRYIEQHLGIIIATHIEYVKEPAPLVESYGHEG